MSETKRRLEQRGWTLPPAMAVPRGVLLPFPWVLVRDNRAFVSGHGPQEPDGALAGPFGKVGEALTVEEGYELARKVALAMLGSLERELGDLDRVTGWARVFGMVNAAPDFERTPAVVNGFSDVILAVFGPERGRHARSAIGVATLPFHIAVEVEAEVLLRP